jgi:hypothetical protein
MKHRYSDLWNLQLASGQRARQRQATLLTTRPQDTLLLNHHIQEPSLSPIDHSPSASELPSTHRPHHHTTPHHTTPHNPQCFSSASGASSTVNPHTLSPPSLPLFPPSPCLTHHPSIRPPHQRRGHPIRRPIPRPHRLDSINLRSRFRCSARRRQYQGETDNVYK